MSSATPSRPVPGRIFSGATALLVLCCASLAGAATHVKDDAQMFSQPAVQQAEQQLDGLQRRGRNVIIETMAEPPAEVRDRIVGDPSQRNQAILQLAEQRAQSAGADVYVLINKTPGNLQIAERRAMQTQGLPAATRGQIADAMLGQFKNKQFDQGLSAGVSMLTQTLGSGQMAAPSSPPPMPANVPAPVPQSRTQDNNTYPTPVPTGGAGGGVTSGRHLGCCGLVGIGLLIVIGITLFRRFTGGGGARRMGGPGYGAGPVGGNYPAGGYPQGGYPQGGYPQGGYPQQRTGGGFGSGMAGGVLGGVLGSVLGNRMGHGHDGGGHAQDTGGGGYVGGGGSTPQDTGYVGGGGDFDAGGASSSGGDFGSNDLGGGGASDYTGGGGGGDFGGGGDSGGGGGDSGGSSGGDF